MAERIGKCELQMERDSLEVYIYIYIKPIIHRKQLNIFSRKVYRTLAPVYDNEKENWRILTNKEIYASVKRNPTIIETIRLNRLRWFGHVQKMEENRIPKRVLFMNLGTTKLRGRPRNR